MSFFQKLLHKQPAPTRPHFEHLEPMLTFLAGIGLPVREEHFREKSFLPGILIRNGQLVIDRARLLYPGDVLHEAGHLAVTPADQRPGLQADIAASNPERAGDELAVQLWSYAASLHLSIPPEVVFHPAGYKGDADWLLGQYQRGSYPGLPLLAWMGLTTNEGFPAMTRWVRA